MKKVLIFIINDKTNEIICNVQPNQKINNLMRSLKMIGVNPRIIIKDDL